MFIHRQKKAQNVIEYIMLLTLVTAVVMAMGPICKRFTQGMIRLVADQVGNQKAADQQNMDDGFLSNAFTATRMTSQGVREDLLGNTTYYPFSQMVLDSIQYSNLGLSEE